MGLFSPVIRKYLEQYNEHATGLLLDVGCGDKPHRAAFTKVSSYIGLDRPSEPYVGSPRAAARKAAIDLHGSAEALPFQASSFDTVAAFQLIEHLPEPMSFLRETARVLKPGGKVILTLPLINPVHEAPYDFFRYTPYGMEHLCTKAGLRIIESVPMGGGWLTVGYLACLLLAKEAESMTLTWKHSWRSHLSFRIYKWLARLDQKHFHPEFTLNYLLVAIKDKQ